MSREPALGGQGDLALLREEMQELRIRLAEADETLTAIRQGDVDALVVGSDIYTLDSSNAAANRLRQDVLAQMKDAVLAFDADDHLVFMNPAAEKHYAKDASTTLGRLKGEVFTEIWPGGEAERAAAFEALRVHGVWRGNLVHRNVDSGDTHVETTISALRDGGGADMGCLYVIRDITERVLAERALAQTATALKDADRRKDEFLATLAHELRNPLAPIRNALHIMALSPEAQVKESARTIIERQLAQLVHLVDDLLDVSRISQGKVELRIELADVVEAVQEALETSLPMIQAGKHELTLVLPPAGTLFVDADVTRLCQIIANLLNNAAKYTPDGGRIQVTAQRQDGLAVISVEDSGVGIPVPLLPRVFELFTQVDRSSDRSQGGLGIGLALVRQLVEMHGGTVEADSKGPGLGSTFTVRLPVSERLPPAEPGIEAHKLQAAGDKGVRVLVVDDNVDGAETMAQFLGILGYETRTVHDGLTAVDTAASFRPHVVILDIGLPQLNGHEVAKRIRQAPGGEEMLLVAVSGWGQAEDRQKSRDAGFDRHFVKPVELEVLMEVVSLVRKPQ
ncbi:ATP-binding protein [Ramlibacter sp. XY19]|uniref:hybrid sensor histidine kinase/response regulator n=1 Tax=Ramlibacter paludis TaxID=2908000 RepID=UPI0023DB2A97|nr:ATP-binding protein [Ramlibacter paludis]MCG2592312.1 ATP-binding protein [Ramlibacter paludis]